MAVKMERKDAARTRDLDKSLALMTAVEQAGSAITRSRKEDVYRADDLRRPQDVNASGRWHNSVPAAAVNVPTPQKKSDSQPVETKEDRNQGDGNPRNEVTLDDVKKYGGTGSVADSGIETMSAISDGRSTIVPDDGESLFSHDTGFFDR